MSIALLSIGTTIIFGCHAPRVAADRVVATAVSATPHDCPNVPWGPVPCAEAYKWVRYVRSAIYPALLRIKSASASSESAYTDRISDERIKRVVVWALSEGALSIAANPEYALRKPLFVSPTDEASSPLPKPVARRQSPLSHSNCLDSIEINSESALPDCFNAYHCTSGDCYASQNWQIGIGALQTHNGLEAWTDQLKWIYHKLYGDTRPRSVAPGILRWLGEDADQFDALPDWTIEEYLETTARRRQYSRFLSVILRDPVINIYVELFDHFPAAWPSGPPWQGFVEVVDNVWLEAGNPDSHSLPLRFAGSDYDVPSNAIGEHWYSGQGSWYCWSGQNQICLATYGKPTSGVKPVDQPIGNPPIGRHVEYQCYERQRLELNAYNNFPAEPWVQGGLLGNELTGRNASRSLPVDPMFLSYYARYGGLEIFGKPISTVAECSNAPHCQWFERSRLESNSNYNPNLNDPVWEVSRGLLGNEAAGELPCGYLSAQGLPGTSLPAMDAIFLTQQVPTEMVRDQYYDVSVTMLNAGSATWTRDGAYRLGSQNPQDNTSWMDASGRVELPKSVGPWESVTFRFRVRARQAGVQSFQWRMVRDLPTAEGGWFGQYSENVAVHILDAPKIPLQIILPTAASIFTVGSRFEIKFKSPHGTVYLFGQSGDCAKWIPIGKVNVTQDNPEAIYLIYWNNIPPSPTKKYRVVAWLDGTDGNDAAYSPYASTNQVAAPPPPGAFLLQAGTALGETGANFDFVVVDWNRDGVTDLVAIKKSQTGTHSTEIHVLSGASGFRQFLLQTGTALHETGDTFDFAVTDWNRDGMQDLVAIKKSETGTHSTEVHVLSGASGFRQFLLQTGTALPETGANFDFAVADWNRDGVADLVAIKKSQTGTHSTEVHVLSGASGFRQFLLQTGTALPETGDDFAFATLDHDGDCRTDLVAIKKSQTGTHSTEVHILSGILGLKSYVLQTGTVLGETGNNFAFGMADWNQDGVADLVAIKKSETGTHSTEVHILRY